MQQIAREFNFAETAFVLPATNNQHTRRLRIFTPKAELPFAGHPTIGTACALVHGSCVDLSANQSLILESGIGLLRVSVRQGEDALIGSCTLFSKPVIPRESPNTSDMAAVLSLNRQDVVETFFASAGLPFCFVRACSREAVDDAVVDQTRWAKKMSDAYSPHIFIFVSDENNDGTVYARMFAPNLGIYEDPATGSACAALVGALAVRASEQKDVYRLTVKQGVLMGRPSEITAIARMMEGEMMSISISGATRFVAEGKIEVPGSLLQKWRYSEANHVRARHIEAE
jgi:trans-2,3-dihydro-3-hydroxyanthranilate isomerase